MYPFAIINNFGSKIERVYRDFAQRVNKELFKSPLPPFTKGGVERSPLLQRGTKGDYIVNDAANVLELLEEIRLNYGQYVDQEKLEKIIAENMNLLDGWSTSQLNRMIENQNAAMGVGVIGQDAINRVSTVNKIPLIPRKDSVTMANIPLANNSQRLLQNDAYSRYFRDVEDIINKAIIDNPVMTEKILDDVTKQILDKVDMNAKRARFWAEDQAAIFQAEQTRIKAQRAGYTHYRWKCQGNARPSHAVHRDQIYSWNVGVNNLSRPGARHPGEDYRCHCTPEIVSPEDILKSGVGSPPPREPQSTENLVYNYNGIQKGKVKSAFDSVEFSKDMDYIGRKYNIDWIIQDVIMGEGLVKEIEYQGKYRAESIFIKRTFVQEESGLVVSHDLMDIPIALQGLGFSKDTNLALYKQYLNMGVKEIAIFANDTVGGYSWAKYGFVAIDKFDVVRIYKEAMQKVKDAGGVFKVTDSRGKVSNLTERDLEKVKEYIDGFYSEFGDKAEFPMERLANTKYGKALLLNSKWNGRMNLTNQKQVEYFEKYIRNQL